METTKQSFLSNMLSEYTYNYLRGYAKFVIIFGSCILVILFSLSFFLHSGIIKWFLELVTGPSLLFMIYMAAWVLILDFKVNVEKEELDFWAKPKKKQKSKAYQCTMIWSILLILLSFCAIYFSKKYTKQYAFECSTILVDQRTGIYHLIWIDDCEIAAEAYHLEEMKGFEIDTKNYTLCEWCQEYAEDVEDEYEINQWRR